MQLYKTQIARKRPVKARIIARRLKPDRAGAEHTPRTKRQRTRDRADSPARPPKTAGGTQKEANPPQGGERSETDFRRVFAPKKAAFWRLRKPRFSRFLPSLETIVTTRFWAGSKKAPFYSAFLMFFSVFFVGRLTSPKICDIMSSPQQNYIKKGAVFLLLSRWKN